MAEQAMPPVSETDLALISFARVVLDVLYATTSVRPADVDPLLAHHQKLMTDAAYPTAAGILASIRNMSGDPKREQMREGLHKLVQGRTQGSA